MTVARWIALPTVHTIVPRIVAAPSVPASTLPKVVSPVFPVKLALWVPMLKVNKARGMAMAQKPVMVSRTVRKAVRRLHTAARPSGRSPFVPVARAPEPSAARLPR